MNTIMNNFADSQIVSRLLDVQHIVPKNFRLSVATPNDTASEGYGQYKVEAHVLLRLLDTAYSEIVSAATQDHAPVADWRENESEDTLPPETLEATITRASVILRYAEHIASIKDGGAEWLRGFETREWMAAHDDEAAKLAVESKADLTPFIAEGRVKLVTRHQQSRLQSFDDWCRSYLGRTANQPSDWRHRVALALGQGIELESVPVNVAQEYIGSIVEDGAFGREKSRLEEAIQQVANRKYNEMVKIQEALPESKEAEKTLKKVWEFLPYSTWLLADTEALKASDTYQDHALDLEVKQMERAAQEDLRQALRQQALLDIQTRAKQIEATTKQAAAIRKQVAKAKKDLGIK